MAYFKKLKRFFIRRYSTTKTMPSICYSCHTPAETCCLKCNGTVLNYCRDLCGNIVLSHNDRCNICDVIRQDEALLAGENELAPDSPELQKKISTVRLPDKFTGRPRRIRYSKFFHENQAKRRNKVARDGLRRLKVN